MPELPEAEFGRRTSEAVALGRRIESVDVSEDLIIFDNKKAKEVSSLLEGRKVAETHRRGKYIWWILDRGPHPIFHFGMTGAFRTPGDDPLRYESSPKQADESWPPRFCKLRFRFDDGGELALVNKRRLGRVLFRDDPAGEKPISALGFDPLLDAPDESTFASLLEPKKGTLKGLLLDQKFAAGVGNWIADEVLYQAGLDPRRPANSLRAEEVGALRQSLLEVIEFAVSVDARKDDFPKTWLFHQRWGKKSGQQISTGETIEHMTVAGRTTAWVPAKQR